MAGGSGEKSSEEGKQTARVKRSHKSQHGTKRKDGKDAPPPPDLDELRMRRADYYTRPERERMRSTTYDRPADVVQETATNPKKRESRAAPEDTIRRSTTRKRRDSVHGYVYSSQNGSGKTKSNEAIDTSRSSRRSKGKAVVEDTHSSRPSRTASVRVPVLPSLRPALKRSYTTSARVVGNRLEPSRDSEPQDHVKPAKPASVTPSRRTSRRHAALYPLMRSHTVPTAAPPAPRLIECLTCGSDDIPVHKSAKLACGHRMCHSCLKRIFNLSTTDPAHMPPKCCTSAHIPLKHVDALFDNRFKLLWNKKYQEYKTQNRLYCPSKGCGEWIKPSHIHADTRHPNRKYGVCKRCKTKVCATCNNKYHKRSECPNDPATAAFIATAKERGWQSCYNCKAMVELKEGCNHMTCRCTAEFCMLCGLQWKTCECPWFNHAGLADADRLREMRVPGNAIPIRRRTVGTGPQRTYAEEVEARRRQERDDELLARRMQFDADFRVDNRVPIRRTPAPARDPAAATTFAVGNAATHFLNDDFVRNAANVVMRAFDESAAGYGRRGEREANRRGPTAGEQSGYGRADAGLATNAFGDASVVNAGVAGLRAGEAEGKKKRANFTRIARNGGAAQGGKSERIRGWLANVE